RPNCDSTVVSGLGQTVQVPVYLLQSTHAGQPDTTVLSQFGLGSGGVLVDFTHSIPSGAFALSAALNPGFETNASGFPFVSNTAGGGQAAFSGGTTSTNLLFPPPTPAPQSVLVGTYTFRGDIVGNVTTLMTTGPHISNLAYTEFQAG